jgi:hypothetical protein
MVGACMLAGRCRCVLWCLLMCVKAGGCRCVCVMVGTGVSWLVGAGVCYGWWVLNSKVVGL